MSKTFFSFAIADSMFSEGNLEITRTSLTITEAKKFLESSLRHENLITCLNPSHQATIVAMKQRFGIEVPIPETAPKVVLNVGDELLVMSVRGLPRLDATRHEYTEEEVASATFSFSVWRVREDLTEGGCVFCGSQDMTGSLCHTCGQDNG